MVTKHLTIGYALAISVGVLAAGSVRAAPYPNLPICTAPYTQGFPQHDSPIASDLAGGAYVAWSDTRVDPNHGGDIYIQHVVARGIVDPAWPSNGLLVCAAIGNQGDAVVAQDGHGGAFVAWYDERSGLDQDIYAQHVLGNGTLDPQWPSGGLAVCTAVKNQNYPVIISDRGDGVYVGWTDYRNAADADVFLQHLLPAGHVDSLWPSNGLKVLGPNFADFPGDQSEVSLLCDRPDAVLVVFQSDFDIYVQRVLVTGQVDPGWPDFGAPASVAGPYCFFPVIASDSSGGCFASWYTDLSTPYTIRATHVLSSGAIDPSWSSNGLILCTGSGRVRYPRIVDDRIGGAMVVWGDQRTGAASIYAAHIKPNGALSPGWPANGLNVAPVTGSKSLPTVGADGMGGFLAAWQDGRNGNTDIYAQHVRFDGSLDPEWSAGGVPVCTAAGTQSYPYIMADVTGESTIAWMDNRFGSSSGSIAGRDIYGQHVTSHGRLGVDILSVPEQSEARIRIKPAAGNPSRGSGAVVLVTTLDAGPLKAQLFDIMGRLVSSVSFSRLGLGTTIVHFPSTANAPDGVYFATARQRGLEATTRVVIAR